MALLIGLAAACSHPPDPAATVQDTGSMSSEQQLRAGDLGLVADATQTDDGTLFVLDAGQRQLVVVVPGSGIRQTLGRTGHGPGEFLEPISLAAGHGNVYLLDRGTQRLEIYQKRRDGTTGTGSTSLDFVPEDLCTMEDRLFILGQRNGYLVHEVSVADGKVVRSLVRDPAKGDPMLGAYYGSGFVQCGPGDELTVLPLLRSEISRYSAANGRELGRMRIPGYRETRVTRTAGGIVYQGPPGDAADYASSLVALGDGRFLVQIGPVPRGARRHEFSSLRSFVLSWRDNSLTELGPTLPRIVNVHRDTAVAVRTDPVPGVSLIPTSAFSPTPSGRAASRDGGAESR